MPCFIKLSNHVIEAVPKVQLLNHSVILNNVKNLNTFIVCLQILRCSQNDKVKNSAIYLFGQSPMVNITLKIDITHEKINILFIFIFSVPSATFAQQSDLLESTGRWLWNTTTT